MLQSFIFNVKTNRTILQSVFDQSLDARTYF